MEYTPNEIAIFRGDNDQQNHWFFFRVTQHFQTHPYIIIYHHISSYIIVVSRYYDHNIFRQTLICTTLLSIAPIVEVAGDLVMHCPANLCLRNPLLALDGSKEYRNIDGTHLGGVLVGSIYIYTYTYIYILSIFYLQYIYIYICTQLLYTSDGVL